MAWDRWGLFRIGGDGSKMEYIFELTDFILTELDPELGTAQPLLVSYYYHGGHTVIKL